VAESKTQIALDKKLEVTEKKRAAMIQKRNNYFGSAWAALRRAVMNRP